jgi:NADH:ubiquinone oxidoreductase subunit 2 (subunit N)
VIKVGFSLKQVKLQAYQQNLGKLSMVVAKAAADVQGEASKSIAMNSGKYRQYGDHWSSPPGTPPNSDTGTLAGSIKTKPLTATSYLVVVEAKYGVPLELGWISKAGNHVPARPFLRPAVEYVAPSFQAACKVILKGGK